MDIIRQQVILDETDLHNIKEALSYIQTINQDRTDDAHDDLIKALILVLDDEADLLYIPREDIS